MSEPGWAVDPTGRFTQRWFDGHDWTDDVLGADGRSTTDALPRTSSGLAAPTASTAGPTVPSAASTPPQPQPAGSPSTAPAPPAHASSPVRSPAAPQTSSGPGTGGATTTGLSVRYLGSVISGVGLVLVLLSLFVLNWADQDPSSFGDLRNAFDGADLTGAPVVDQFVQLYATTLGYLLLVVVVAGVVVIAVRARSAGRGTHAAVAAAAGVGAVAHAVAVERLFRGTIDPSLGAWLAVGGYLAVIAGAAVAPTKRAGA